MALGDQIVHILRSCVIKPVTIGFAILLFVIVVWLVYEYQKQPYWNAKRARSAGDVKLATELFEKAVREDSRLSGKALLALMKMDEPESLSHLIKLLDLPEMNYITANVRVMMYEVIRERTAGTTADSLPLDPRAPQKIRAEQKRLWQDWLAKAKEQYNWQNGRFVPKKQE